MFRRDGAVVPQDNLVDRLVHLAPAREELHGIGANGLAHVEVDIAVAEMTERHRTASRDDRLTPADRRRRRGYES